MTDRWGRRLFTTGAVVLLLLGLAHSLSLFEKPVPANETERQLFDLMSNYKFNLMGSMRSANDFERGFSIAFLVGMLGLGMLDLVLARERAELLKRVALTNTIWLADDRSFPALFLCGADRVSSGRAANLCAGLAEVAGIC